MLPHTLCQGAPAKQTSDSIVTNTHWFLASVPVEWLPVHCHWTHHCERTSSVHVLTSRTAPNTPTTSSFLVWQLSVKPRPLLGSWHLGQGTSASYAKNADKSTRHIIVTSGDRAVATVARACARIDPIATGRPFKTPCMIRLVSSVLSCRVCSNS